MGYPYILTAILLWAPLSFAGDLSTNPLLAPQVMRCRDLAEAMAAEKVNAVIAAWHAEHGPRPKSFTRIAALGDARHEDRTKAEELLGKDLLEKHPDGVLVYGMDSSWSSALGKMLKWRDARLYVPNGPTQGYTVHRAVQNPDGEITKTEYRAEKLPTTTDNIAGQNKHLQEKQEKVQKLMGLTNGQLEEASKLITQRDLGADLQTTTAVAVLTSADVRSVLDGVQGVWHMDRKALVEYLGNDDLFDYTVDLDDIRQQRFGALRDACRHLRSTPMKDLVDKVISEHKGK